MADHRNGHVNQLYSIDCDGEFGDQDTVQLQSADQARRLLSVERLPRHTELAKESLPLCWRADEKTDWPGCSRRARNLPPRTQSLPHLRSGGRGLFVFCFGICRRKDWDLFHRAEPTGGVHAFQWPAGHEASPPISEVFWKERWSVRS